MRYWLFVLVFAVACGGDDEKDNKASLMEYIPASELFQEDIEKAVKNISAVAQRGNYEYVDVLLKQCRSPFNDVQVAAGEALETICGVSFNLTSDSIEERRMGLAEAIKWWEPRRETFLRDAVLNRLKPYLAQPFDTEGSADYENYALRELDYVGDTHAAPAIEILKSYGKSVWPPLLAMLKDPQEPQRLKENIAFILSGQNVLALEPHMTELVEKATRFEQELALYRIWGELDVAAASEHLLGRYAVCENEKRAAYLKTLMGLDREKVKGLLSENIFSSDHDESLFAAEAISQFGFCEFLPDMTKALLRHPTSNFFNTYVFGVRRLGLRRALDLCLAHLRESQLSQDQKLILFEVLLVYSEKIPEIEKLKFLEGDAEDRRLATKLLVRGGTKLAVNKLKNVILLEDTSDEVLDAMMKLTGHDFKRIDQDAFYEYSQFEKGTPEELRLRFIHNRAELWWVEHRDMSKSQWIIKALNEAGFSTIKSDQHPLSLFEKNLMRRLIDMGYEDTQAALRTLIETEEDVNIRFVIDEIRQRHATQWVDLLRQYVNDKSSPWSTEITMLFCELAGPAYHRHLKALLKSPSENVRYAAENGLIRISAIGEIGNLINDVEHETEERAIRANNILRAITKNNFGEITGITKPQRKPVVDMWNRWWKAVHDESVPGGWRRREVDRLLTEMAADDRSPLYWERLKNLTHFSLTGNDMDQVKNKWEKHRQEWGPHGREVVDLLSGNWWRVERAEQILLRRATPQDVNHMISLLDVNEPANTAVLLVMLRQLTEFDMGYDPTKGHDHCAQALEGWGRRWYASPLRSSINLLRDSG